MFEYHGWVKISESTCEAEDDEDLLDALIPQISGAIRELSDDWGDVALFVQNGSHYLRLHGSRNHRQDWVPQLFATVGAIAKGSYGLLYVRDDEDPDYLNEFQVWRMARGAVSCEVDTFLSPCDPLLETYG